MKHLLLFFQHKRAKRLSKFSKPFPVFCLSGCYGYSTVAAKKEYVCFQPFILVENVKNYLFNKSSKTRCTRSENIGFSYCSFRLFLRSFNIDIQRITVREMVPSHLFFLIRKRSFYLPQGHQSSLPGITWQSLFYKQIDEHFYSIRGLFEQTPQSDRHIKRQEMSGGYFVKMNKQTTRLNK